MVDVLPVTSGGASVSPPVAPYLGLPSGTPVVGDAVIVTGTSPTTYGFGSSGIADDSLPPVAALEVLPGWAFGASYIAGPPTASGDGARFCDRFVSRMRLRSLTNLGVSGADIWAIVKTVLDNWVAGTSYGVVMANLCGNNLQNDGTHIQQDLVASIRLYLAILNSSARFEDTSSSMVFAGTWSASSGDSQASSNTSHTTSNVGDYVDLYVPSDPCYVAIKYGQASNGVITATRNSDGAVVGTFDTSGASFTPVQGGIRLAGLGGSTTVRLTLTSGNLMTVDCILPQTTTPPLVIWVQEPDVPANSSTQNTVQDTLTYPAIQTMINAEFPATLTATQGSGWDPVLGTIVGGEHISDWGNWYIAGRMVAAVEAANLGFTTGQNITNVNPTVPSGSAPSYTATAVPHQVGTVTATPGSGQMALSWSAPSNGGSAITDKVVRYRTTSGPGSWTTFAHSASATASITVTGLTNSTSYDFEVAAVNAIGQGPFSALVTATPTTGFTVPAAPTLVSVTPGNTQNVLIWTDGSNGGTAITNHWVERSTTTGGESHLTEVGAVLTYTDTGLTNGTQYFYKVTAVNSVGEGSASNEISGTPALVIAPVQSNPAAANTSTITVGLTQNAAVNNLLVAAFSGGNPSGAGTPSLPSGWTLAETVYGSGHDICYIAFRKATSADTTSASYTFGYSTNSSSAAVVIAEFPGCTGLLDATGVGSNGTSFSNSPGVTGISAMTTSARALIIGALEEFNAGSSADSWAAQSGSTAATWNDVAHAGNASGVFIGVAMGYAVVSATGTYGGACTTAEANYAGVVAAFPLT